MPIAGHAEVSALDLALEPALDLAWDQPVASVGYVFR